MNSISIKVSGTNVLVFKIVVGLMRWESLNFEAGPLSRVPGSQTTVELYLTMHCLSSLPSMYLSDIHGSAGS
jgi:hypothetical protein